MIQVKIWFQNKRSKQKKGVKHIGHGSIESQDPQGLAVSSSSPNQRPTRLPSAKIIDSNYSVKQENRSLQSMVSNTSSSSSASSSASSSSAAVTAATSNPMETSSFQIDAVPISSSSPSSSPYGHIDYAPNRWPYASS